MLLYIFLAGAAAPHVIKAVGKYGVKSVAKNMLETAKKKADQTMRDVRSAVDPGSAHGAQDTREQESTSPRPVKYVNFDGETFVARIPMGGDVSSEAISVSVEEGVIKISAEVEHTSSGRREKKSVEEEVKLPTSSDFDFEKMEVSLHDNGVLEMRIPKKETPKRTTRVNPRINNK